MAQALKNSYSGGTKRKVSLNQSRDLIQTHVLYQFLNYGDTDIEPVSPTIYIEGTMGIGKSMILRQVKNYITKVLTEDIGLIDLRMAGMSGTDIQGIPVPELIDQKTVLVWIKDALLPGILATGQERGILFLDEINQVEDSSVLSLLYQLLLDKKMNDYSLPEGWVIVSAGNRAEDGGVYNRLPAPIRDRMLILEIELNKEEWLDWSKKENSHPAVISFVDLKVDGKEVLHTYDPELEIDGDEECANYVFATPRSWTQVSTEIRKFERKLLIPGTGDYLYPKEVLGHTIAGLVGDKLGKIFEQFYNSIGTTNVNKYLELSWVNSEPLEETDKDLSKENLTYLATYAEVNGTLEQKMNMIYFMAYNNLGYLVKMLQNTFTPQELEYFKSYTIDNGNSNLLNQVGSGLDR